MPLPRAETWTVAAGTTQVIAMASADRQMPATVNAIPGAGGTALVEYSLTPSAIDTPAGATWMPWPSGAVSAAAVEVLESPVVALRFTATTQAAVFNLVASQL